MKLLVTGGAGFIGSHLATALVARGHAVSILDNLSTGSRSNVPAGAMLHEVDLRQRERVVEIVAKVAPDVVFHLAAQADVRRSMAEPEYDASVNVIGGLNVLEAAVRAGSGHFVYASTGGAVYGEPTTDPVSEDHAIRPLSNYGASKAALELYLGVYAATAGLATTALRYANVYGPGQNPKGEAGVVAIFSTLMLAGERPTIFGDGSKTRDYVFVADIVAANLAALEGRRTGVFNIGTGVRTTDQQVFEAVRDALGSSLEPIYGPRRKGEVEHIALSADRARKQLNWTPSVSFTEGVKRAVAWYAARA